MPHGGVNRPVAALPHHRRGQIDPGPEDLFDRAQNADNRERIQMDVHGRPIYRGGRFRDSPKIDGTLRGGDQLLTQPRFHRRCRECGGLVQHR